jgi:hypothetical protein
MKKNKNNAWHALLFISIFRWNEKSIN